MKKIFRNTACVIVCSAMVLGGTCAAFADETNVSAETAFSAPVAGLSFSFCKENSILSYLESTAKAETSTIEEAVVETKTTSYAVAKVDDAVNIRTAPTTESEVVGKLYDRSVGTVLGQENGWVKIQSGSCTGYVSGEYLVIDDAALLAEVGTRVATVTTETLRVRKEASVDSAILDLVPEGDELRVGDESKEGWVGVVIEDTVGYVSTEFVSLRTDYVQAESVEEEIARIQAENEAREMARRQAIAAQAAANQVAAAQAAAASYTAPTGSIGADVVNYAMQFLGHPYVYGGNSLTGGVDCSGFTKGVYSAFGVALPRTSYSQAGCGYSVSMADARPGDIVIYSGHVAIYAGGGTIVHAQNEATGIVVSGIGGGVLDIRRVIG